MQLKFSPRQSVWLSLLIATLVGVGLWGIGVWRNHSFDFWYLPFNLSLALIPLLLAVWLVHLLKARAWSNWLPLAMTLLWILFLPNSFYIISDFIHLTETPRADIVQDVVMLAQFSFTGLAFGFVSLFLVHQEFIKRVGVRFAAPLVGVILLLCSFAIYLGRDLRWNSWDIIVQPFGLISDILQHLFNPGLYPLGFVMTSSFFVMLGSMYFVLWQVSKALVVKLKGL